MSLDWFRLNKCDQDFSLQQSLLVYSCFGTMRIVKSTKINNLSENERYLTPHSAVGPVCWMTVWELCWIRRAGLSCRLPPGSSGVCFSWRSALSVSPAAQRSAVPPPPTLPPRRPVPLERHLQRKGLPLVLLIHALIFYTAHEPWAVFPWDSR